MSSKTKKRPAKSNRRPVKARPRNRVKQRQLPGMEQPRNQKIETLIDRWHDAKAEFKTAGTEFGNAATLLGAAFEDAQLDAYEYGGKIVTYKASAKKLSEKSVEEEAVNGQANGEE